MSSSKRVAEKVALVTGAASGLGLASAIKLLDEGAKVYFSDISLDGLDKIKPFLKNYDSNHYEIGVHDVASEESWVEVIDQVRGRFNQLNILLNSAGIALGGDVVSTSLDVWKKVHDVNLDSIFLGCKIAIPLMAENEPGSIINISSISGIVAGWNTAAYNSSKAGVKHLSKSVALYCAKKGYNIRSNTIHPAFIDTPILNPHKQAFGEKEAIAKLSRQIPMNKIGDTDDVAYAVIYLASDESKFITGSEIILDGGLSAGQRLRVKTEPVQPGWIQKVELYRLPRHQAR